MEKFVTQLKRQRTGEDEPTAGSKAVTPVSYELVSQSHGHQSFDDVPVVCITRNSLSLS